MSDKQKPPKPTEDSDFGKIQISSEPLPPPPRPTAAPKRKTSEAASEKTARRKKAARSSGRSWLRIVLPLLPIPLFFLLYLAGVYYLLPMYIKGKLAERLGQQLDRPVSVGQASLTPFTFALHLGEINIGPAAAQPEESDLARIAALDAWFRPAGLLRGKVVLNDVRIDRLRANLVRSQDGSFNALPPRSSLFSGLDMLPDWLQVHGLRLHRSTIHFFDQPSGKKHLIEHIEFVLPADAQGAEPSLSAAVNSSPLQIIGQKEGGEEARLTLKLDEIDPQQYLGLFPGLAEKLSLNAGRADALLEIILQDKKRPGQGPTVSGELLFTDLLAQSADAEEHPEQAFRLAAPEAKLVLKANPLKNLYTVEELRLEAPQLNFPENQQDLLHGERLAAKAAALLNYGPIGLAVNNLSLSKGQVKSGAAEWKEINLTLTGFQNAKAVTLADKKPASVLSLAAVSGETAFSFKGNMEPQGSFVGNLSLKNVEAADLLQPYLTTGDTLRLSKGMADIAGDLRLEAGKPGSFAKASISLRDVSLQQSKTTLLSAKLLQATDCTLESSSGIVCGKAVLEQADFADTDFFLPGSGKDSGLRFACKSLELKKSAAKMQLGEISLPLSDLNLKLNGLPGQLDLQAAISKWGSLEINGQAVKEESGLNLTGTINLRNAEAALLRPYLADSSEKISFLQGGADISGALRLNQGKLNLANSTVALRDFVLQRKGAALLSGKSMKGKGCSLDSSNGIVCANAVLEEADFADTDFFLPGSGKDSGLRFACNSLELKKSVAAMQLGGISLPLSDVNLNLSGLPGQLALKAAIGKWGGLEISGKADRGKEGLNLTGTINLRNAGAALLRPYLADSREKISFRKGGADISGALRLEQGRLNLSDGTAALRNFVLQRKGAALLSGKSMKGKGCTLNHTARSMSCASISVDQAEFADSDFFLQPAGRLHLAADKVDIKNSAAKLRLVGAEPMALSGLNLNLSGLQGKQPGKISMNAAADKSGSLEINGTASATSSGLAVSGSITLRKMDASLLSPYLSQGNAIRFSQGGLTMSGTGSLNPAKDGTALSFSSGAVQVHDFALQHNGAALLSGKTITGADCSFDHRLNCANISVEQADFADTDFFLRPAGRLHLASDKVEIKNSSATLRLAGAESLALSGLNLNLSGLHGNEPGTIIMEAAAGKSGKLEIKGTASAADAGLSVSGSLALHNMPANLLNPYLAHGKAILFKQGRLDISGAGSLNPAQDGAVLSLSSSSVQVQDFALQGNGAALVSGKIMTGEDCSLDRQLVCSKLALSQADFAAQAAGFFFRPEGKLGFACNELAISNSTALLPVGAGANRPELPLSGLNLRLNQNQENNLQLEANAGSQGNLRAEGTLRQDGGGTASLTGTNLDIRLFNKAVAGVFRKDSALALQQGRLSFTGQFSLPENRFSGQFSIDDLAAGNDRGDSLRWQKAAGSGAVLTLSPFKASVDQLSLQEPAAWLASEASNLPGAFFALFQELPPIAIGQCSISNGSLNSFSGIQATAAPLRAGEAADFSLSGTMHGSEFSLNGKAGKDGTAIEQLTAERLPLASVAQKLAKQLNLKGGSISRTITGEEDRLDFSGFIPQPESEYALTLALLTDQDGAFSMPLQSMPFSASTETVSATATDMIQRLRLQCLAATWAVMEKLVPDISNAQKIAFIPGDKVPDFMNGLNGIRTLFSIRPHIGWAVQGCYDDEADKKLLLAQIQKNEAQKVAEENLQRQKEMERLLAKETERQEKLNKAGLPIVKDMLPEIKAQPDLQILPMPEAELPENVLPELARARAAVVREHLISTLGIPADHLQVHENGDCGAQAELIPVPVW